jgi:glycosyltransferase involved in cell wall biosynthesis
MAYGGVERMAWRLTRLLTSLGCDLVPIASADSDFGSAVPGHGLNSVQSWCREHRNPLAYADDVPGMLDGYATHTAEVVKREQADAVILLGPSPQVLKAAVEAVRPAVSTIIALLCNGPQDNGAVIPLLESEPEVTLLCESEMQRAAFTTLASRIEVATDGIPVTSIPFSPDPAARRLELMRNPAFSSIRLRPERPLLGQIDYFHPNKAMLITLETFRASGLARTHDLILAGGMGWQLPGREGAGATTEGELYLHAMRSFVEKHNLADSVQLLGSLPGWIVAELYGAMDIAISPVRLPHGPLWTYSPGIMDPESYGYGRAIANSAGTPVLMSQMYDPSFTPKTRPDLRFGDPAEGADRLRHLAAFPNFRAEMRSFAERRDTMTPSLARYVRLIRDRAERNREMSFDPSPAALGRALSELTRLEGGQSHG